MANISAKAVVIDIITQVTDKTSEGINKAKARIDKLGDSLKKTQQRTEKIGKTKSELSIEDKATQAIQKVGKGLEKSKGDTDRLNNSLKKTQQQLDRVGKSKGELSLKDRATEVIQKVSKSLKDTTKKAWSITVKILDKATAPIRGIFKLLKSPIVQIGAVLGISVGLKDTIDTYKSFEQSMANVKAIIQNSADYKETDYGTLRNRAMELGESTVFSASEAAQGMTYLGQNGWSTKAIYNAMPALLDLSAAGGTDLATTSNIIASTMSPFGLSAEGDPDVTAHVADVFAATSMGTSTNIEQLGETMKYAAPIAKEFGMRIEDASAMAGIMANSGIRDSMAGTAIRSSLMGMANPTASAKAWMDKLDLSFVKENGDMKEIADIVVDLDKSFQSLSDSERLSAANSIFGSRASTAWLGILGQGSEKVNSFAESLKNCDGAAEKMAETKLDTLEGSLKLLESAAEGAKIRIGEKLAPSIRQFAQWLVTKIPTIEKAVGKAIDKITEKMQSVKKTMEQMKNSPSWQNAGFFDKIGIAWNKIVAEPFEQWWNSTGKAWFAKKAGEIGNGIGEGITLGLLALLGFSPQEAVGDGISIGASFAEGFAKGFDAKKIGEAILNSIKGIFKDAATLLPGGEQASSTSLLSAGLLAYGGMRVGKGVKGIMSLGGSIAGMGGLTSAASAAGGTSAISGLLGSAASGTGLLGVGANAAITMGAGNLAGGASLSAGALSALGLGSIAGAVVGIAGIGKGIQDIAEGNAARGTSKLGMVGAGAAAGAGIGALFGGVGAVPGALIGAGIGGAAALWSGNKFFKTEEEKKIEAAETAIRKEKERQLAIEKNIYKLKNTRTELKNLNLSIDKTKELRDKWQEVRAELDRGGLSEEDRIAKQEEMKGIVSQLADLYPSLVQQSDESNARLGEKLDSILAMSENQKRIKELELETQTAQFDKDFKPFIGDYRNTKYHVSSLEEQKSNLDENFPKILEAASEFYLRAAEESKYVQADSETKYEYHKMMAELLDKVNSFMSEAGIDKQYTGQELRALGTADGMEEIQGMVQGKASELNGDLLKSRTVLENQTKQLQEARDKELENISMGVGGSIEEAEKRFEEMDAAQKEAFLDTLKNVAELNYKFKELQEPKYVDFLIKYNIVPSADVFAPGVSGLNATINSFADYAMGAVKKNAAGGIYTGAEHVIVGEAGKEFIIPVTGTNRYRGLGLWEQAGIALGTIPKKAQGGIFANDRGSKVANSPIYERIFNNDEESDEKQTSSNVSSPIDIGGVNLGGINFTFNGTGNSDKESIMQTIREQMPEIANEVAEEIAKALQKFFANMKAIV